MTIAESVISAENFTAKLETIAATGLVERGCVNIIQLDAIEREMRDKWPRRREQVWEHVEKTIGANIDAAKMFFRLNDTCYLICISGHSSDSAKMLCAFILRDTLKFFLGVSSHTDILVRSVISLNDGLVSTIPVLFNEDNLQPSNSTSLATPEPVKNCLPPSCQLMTCGGPLTLEYSTERVINLKSLAAAALRIKVKIIDAITGLPVTQSRLLQLETAALISIDRKTAEYAIDLLSDLENRNAGVFVPISIQTASNPRGRALIQGLFAQHEGESKRRLIIELFNITKGTPAFQLLEATSFLRARAVFGRMDVETDVFDILRNAKLNGIVIDTESEAGFSRALVSKIIGCGDIAKSIAPALLVGPLPKQEYIDVCRIAGATHVSLATPQSASIAVNSQLAAATVSKPYLQLIYISRSKLDQAESTEAQLDAICAKSAKRNQMIFVTGLLVHFDGWFIQVLEGTRSAIGGAMVRIFGDARHSDIHVVSASEVDEREFPHWSMASMSLPRGHPATLEALGSNRLNGLLDASYLQILSLLRAAAKIAYEEDAAQVNQPPLSARASA